MKWPQDKLREACLKLSPPETRNSIDRQGAEIALDVRSSRVKRTGHQILRDQLVLARFYAS